MFQLSVKSGSILLPDISAKTAKYHAAFGTFGNICNLIINVHCSGDRLMYERPLMFVHSQIWLVRCIAFHTMASILCADCDVIVVTCL